MSDIKNFPFFGPIMESLGEKQAKRCLTEFSGVWAYTPRSVYRQALQEHGEAIIKTLVDSALAGDPTALRICADKILPSLKAGDSPIIIELQGNLSEQGQQVLDGLGAGELSPGEATAVMGTLQAQARLVESDDLISRIERLEESNGIRA